MLRSNNGAKEVGVGVVFIILVLVGFFVLLFACGGGTTLINSL